MVLQPQDKKLINEFCRKIGLNNDNNKLGGSRDKKLNQVFAYLETMHSQLRHYSQNRPLTLVECGAGSCFLSMVIYYYYTAVQGRKVRVHCVDTNPRLMEKAAATAGALGLHGMVFHASDIEDYIHDGPVDVVFSLHACDTATDKSIALGVAHNARCIFSVTCCQHSVVGQFRGGHLSGMTKNRAFKDRLIYMVGDSLRGLVLEQHGYQVEIGEFISSRHTGKNVMIRARRGQVRRPEDLAAQYQALVDTFHMVPALESFIHTFQSRAATQKVERKRTRNQQFVAGYTSPNVRGSSMVPAAFRGTAV